MKNWIKLSVLSLSLLSLTTQACDLHGRSGFMPDNGLSIPVGDNFLGGGITEIQFNRVMDKISTLYSGFVAKTGRKLVIKRLWTDPTVNAYADQNTPGVDTIHMFGGLARHQETTEDAMALVACHELGHHVGGAPRKLTATGARIWAANEGQADYWGSMKCLRHYFEGDDNVAVMKNINIPSDVVTKCQSIYINANEIASCERSAMAGLALARLLNAITQGGAAVNFATPDKAIVTQTFDSHPKAQCRLDTYYQASLCDHGFAEVVSQNDANIGVCSLRNGDSIGNRPLCWFKP